MASYTVQQQPAVHPTAPFMYPTQMTAASQPPYPSVPQTINSPPLKYPKRAALGLGLTQMTIGVLFVIFMIIQISLCSYCRRFFVNGGIWCGIIFIVTGLLGCFSSLKTYGRGMIISFMMMSIISACLTTLGLYMGIIDASTGPSYYYMSQFENNNMIKNNTETAMSILLAILSVVEAGVAIASSALCCRAVCNCQNAQATYIQIYNPTTRQVTFIPVQTSFAIQQPIPMVPSYTAGATYPPTQIIPPYTQSDIGAANEDYNRFQENVDGLPAYQRFDNENKTHDVSDA